MSSLFHKKEFLTVVLALMIVSLSCSLSTPANQGVPVQNPVVKAIDTTQPAQPKVIAATNTPEQPTAVPQPTQEITPTEPTLPQADFGGVTFVYDPQIASSVSGEEVPAVNEGQGAPWEIQPATIKFSFDGYSASDSSIEPEILIFPVSDFEKVSDTAAKEIADLRQVIGVHPQTFPNNGLPFLPTWNAGQIMHTKVSYFTFSSGQGVRYLTMYAQNFATVNNKVLFYTYQGLTSDGKYYISAILPVTNAILPPDDTTIPGGDFDKFSQNFPTYITGIEDQLNHQGDDTFVPSLTLLDNLVKSVSITK